MLSFFKVFLIPSVESLHTHAPCGALSVVGEGVQLREQSCGERESNRSFLFPLKCRNTRHKTEGEGLMGRLDNEVKRVNLIDTRETASRISPCFGITAFVLFT